MEIFTLGEGSYSVDATKKFIPFNPQTDSIKDRPGSLFIHVNPFLVKTNNDLILIDSGLGYKDSRNELLLYQHIQYAGFDPDEVTLVLMSHLHYDHCGGLVTEANGVLQPAFPDAMHVIQRGEMEIALSGKSSSYRKPIAETLQGLKNLMLVENSGEVKAGINYELSGGHCPYHQVFLIEENGKKCFYGGDELPEPGQLLRRFIAKYDYNGEKAMHLREEYGKRAAAEGWTCLFYHSKSITAGNIAYNGEHFTVSPAQ